MEGNHLCQECDGTGWVLYRSETINGGFGKPTASAPRATRRATAWDAVTIDFAPAPRWCAAGEATTARIMSRIHNGRDVDNACEAI